MKWVGTRLGHIARSSGSVVQAGGFIYAGLFVLYSVLITMGIAPGIATYADPLIYIASAVWLLYAYLQYKHDTTDMIRLVTRFVVFHGFSAWFILAVAGIDSPLLAAWILLIVASSMYFHGRGFILSTAALFAVIVYGTSITAISVEQAFSIYYLGLLAGFIGGIAALTITQTLRDQRELDASHQQAQLQRDRTTTLINNLTDAVISTDQNGVILLYNAAVLNLLDTNSDIEGKRIDDVLTLHDMDSNAIEMSELFSMATAAVSRDDLTALISDEPMRLEVSYSPIRSSFERRAEDEASGFIVILRDITTAKSLEEERDEFISVVSHELRTPITIAEGTVSNAQLMLERGDMSQEKITSAINDAHEQIVFLARMVNDLSTLSRAERGVADEAEVIDVNELVESLYHEHEADAAQKGLRFDLHLPNKIGSVYASRLYLKELLQNFITNAIKYTQEGSVKLEVKRTREGTVNFAVCDSGIGISKADQKRIFEKFYRAEDYRTRETSGTGLGLYVTAKLAKKLGTHVEMKSRLNHGSTFSVELPLTKR